VAPLVVTRGKHDYLGMTLDFGVDGKSSDMTQYLRQEILIDLPAWKANKHQLEITC
jgi:hypothetical protein